MYQQRYTLAELAQETGVRPRTIRYWIQRGMVPRGVSAGRYGSYTIAHVRRVAAVRELLDQNLSHDDVRDRFSPLIPED